MAEKDLLSSNLDESLQIILDTLPLEHEGQERRKNSLTRADGVVIINMIKVMTAHQGCSIGLSIKQAEAIRNTPANSFHVMNDMVKERKKLLNALGLMTLTAMAFIGKFLFTNIDWTKVWKFFHTQ